jgi:hypothetical protein
MGSRMCRGQCAHRLCYRECKTSRNKSARGKVGDREMCTNDRIERLLTLVSMRPYPASPESPTTHTRRGAARSVSLHGVNALNMDLRRRMLEIDKRCAEWKMQKYRKLLEQVGVGVGHAATTTGMPEGEQRLVTSSEPTSRPHLGLLFQVLPIGGLSSSPASWPKMTMTALSAINGRSQCSTDFLNRASC